MPCTRSWAEGESSWTVVVPGITCRNCEILLLSEVAFTVSMVVMRMSFAELHSTRCMRVACRAALMLSLMAMIEVVRAEPSLKAPCPLQPQRKKKPHQIFRQAFFSLAENPSFPALPPLLQRKKSTTPRYNVFLSRERQEKVYLQSSDTSFRRNPVLSTPYR